MPHLILFPGSKAETEYALQGPRVELGRAPSNHVVIRRRMASRQHAVIERVEGRFFLRDANSYNGTFVNNRAVQEVELVHGDEIRIANTIMRFVDLTCEQGETLPLPAPVPPEEPLELESGDVEGFDADDTTVPDLPRPLATPAPPAPGPEKPRTVARPAAVPPGAAGPAPPVPAAPKAPPRPRRGRAWAWAVPVLLVLAGAILLVYRHQASRATRPAPPPAPSPGSAARADELALKAALAATGEEQRRLLWSFLRTYPQSDQREHAYLALLEVGVSREEVCAHARAHGAPILGSPSDLARRCGP